MEIISKELLSEVLGVKNISSFKNVTNMMYIYYINVRNEKSCLSCNIYELAHKCKEWLKNNVSNSFSGFDNGHRNFCHIENHNIQDRFYENTEHEAIFKTCQWILDSKTNSETIHQG